MIYGHMPPFDTVNEGCTDGIEPRCYKCRYNNMDGGLAMCSTCNMYDKFAPLEEVIRDTPKILDSGNRREFETGAVRDIQEGKGRCDLMPLDVVAEYLTLNNHPNPVIWHIHLFQESGKWEYLFGAIDQFNEFHFKNNRTMLLEVSKHFEEGAKKYGEHNWQKGIPTNCYIDSAVRHYLKFLRGDTDEPHDRAFVWNLLCCIWTCKHKPELNVYRKEENDQNQ